MPLKKSVSVVAIVVVAAAAVVVSHTIQLNLN